MKAGSGGASCNTGSPVQGLVVVHVLSGFQVLVKQGLEEPRAIQVSPVQGLVCCTCVVWFSGVGEAGSGGASRDTGSPVQGLVVVHVLSGFRCW